MRVRIKFTKTGCLKFIGHLDVMRYFQKAVRRAELPAAMSEGFSPHMIMSFAQPLGVGKTSAGEYFDLDLKEEVPMDEIVEKLNAQMAEGITVVRAVRIPEEKKYKAMSMVAAADYLVSFRKGDVTLPDHLDDLVAAFLAQPSIVVRKKTKKSEADVDIRPLIYRMEPVTLDQRMQTEHPSGAEAEAQAVCMRVSAKSGTNLKPELVLSAFADFAGFALEPFDLLIHRVDTLMNAGTEENPDFVPLDAIGEKA